MIDDAVAAAGEIGGWVSVGEAALLRFTPQWWQFVFVFVLLLEFRIFNF